MLLHEKIFLGVGTSMVVLTIGFIIMLEYRKYLRAKTFMEISKDDIVEKIEAYNAKHKGKDMEMDRFRQDYHEYIVEKRLAEDVEQGEPQGKPSDEIQEDNESIEMPSDSEAHLPPDDLASHSNYN